MQTSSLKTRTELHNYLKTFCDNVYYNAPSSMKYPCIMYKLNNINARDANGIKWKINKTYTVTYITSSAKSETDTKVDEIMNTRYLSYDRVYVSDGLYHYVFQISLE